MKKHNLHLLPLILFKVPHISLKDLEIFCSFNLCFKIVSLDNIFCKVPATSLDTSLLHDNNTNWTVYYTWKLLPTSNLRSQISSLFPKSSVMYIFSDKLKKTFRLNLRKMLIIKICLSILLLNKLCTNKVAYKSWVEVNDFLLFLDLRLFNEEEEKVSTTILFQIQNHCA